MKFSTVQNLTMKVGPNFAVALPSIRDRELFIKLHHLFGIILEIIRSFLNSSIRIVSKKLDFLFL